MNLMNEKHKIIIDKSVEIFAEKGYHATSVQEIAEKCGIAKGPFIIILNRRKSYLFQFSNFIMMH